MPTTTVRETRDAVAAPPPESPELSPDDVVRLAYAVARRVVGPEGARDVAQETWIKFHRQRPPDGAWPAAQARAWIRTVATNGALSLVRKAAAAAEEEAEPVDEASDPAEVVADAEEAARRRALARQLLGALPPRQRQLVALRDVEGLAWDDVARVLGENPRTLRSRYTRLWQTLREEAARQERGGARG